MDFAYLTKALLPEMIVAGTALLVILGDLFIERKGLLTVMSLAGIAAALVFTIPDIVTGSAPGLASVDHPFIADNFAVFMKLVFLSLAGLIILASVDYVKRMRNFHGEYLALILLSVLGMMLLTESTNLIAIFVSLEMVSIPIYVLVGFLKDRLSTESSLKYLLLSSVNSGVLLFGLALLFGFTGSATITGVSQTVGEISGSGIWAQPGLILGIVLVLAAFGFKIAAVPFNMWAPDVYEGSPTSITLLLSAGSKLAGFGVLLRILVTVFAHPATLSSGWAGLIAVLAALGMTIGNVLAIPQTNIKRLLAYSGIAHSGYMLVAVAALGFSSGFSPDSAGSLLFYMLAFALAEVLVFTGVMVVSERISDSIDDYAGLGKRSPWLATAITIGLISLTGIPPAAGFIAKFYIFSQAIDNGLVWLIVIAVLNTVISAFYYLRIVRLMWLAKPEDGTQVVSSIWPGLVLIAGSLGVLGLGLFPIWGIKLAEFGARILMG
jgi:NADH-quinone oxidoreductase subunit N